MRFHAGWIGCNHVDEHALKMLDTAGRRVERERRWRRRLSTWARVIVNRQSEEIRLLRAALAEKMREDD